MMTQVGLTGVDSRGNTYAMCAVTGLPIYHAVLVFPRPVFRGKWDPQAPTKLAGTIAVASLGCAYYALACRPNLMGVQVLEDDVREYVRELAREVEQTTEPRSPERKARMRVLKREYWEHLWSDPDDGPSKLMALEALGTGACTGRYTPDELETLENKDKLRAVINEHARNAIVIDDDDVCATMSDKGLDGKTCLFTEQPDGSFYVEVVKTKPKSDAKRRVKQKGNDVPRLPTLTGRDADAFMPGWAQAQWERSTANLAYSDEFRRATSKTGERAPAVVLD